MLCMAGGVGSRYARRSDNVYSASLSTVAEIGGVLGPLSIGIVSDTSGGFAAALYMMTGICFVLLVLLGWLWFLHNRLARRAVTG